MGAYLIIVFSKTWPPCPLPWASQSTTHPIDRERMIVVSISYFMFRRKKYAPEIGIYYSYDIVAYGYLFQAPVRIVRDVSTDAELIFRMVWAFNRYGLSPLHLKYAILDMLE